MLPNTWDKKTIRPNDLVHNCRRGYNQRQNATASIAETQDTASNTTQTRLRKREDDRPTTHIVLGQSTTQIIWTVCAQTTTLHQDMYIQWNTTTMGIHFLFTTSGDNQWTSRLMRTKNKTIPWTHIMYQLWLYHDINNNIHPSLCNQNYCLNTKKDGRHPLLGVSEYVTDETAQSPTWYLKQTYQRPKTSAPKSTLRS